MGQHSAPTLELKEGVFRIIVGCSDIRSIKYTKHIVAFCWEFYFLAIIRTRDCEIRLS